MHVSLDIGGGSCHDALVGFEGWVTVGCSAVALVVSAIALARSLQTSVPRAVADRLSNVEAEATRWRTAAQAVLEEADDLFQRIERKRASAAAAASKASRALGAAPDDEGSPPAPASQTRAQLRLARRRGLVA